MSETSRVIMDTHDVMTLLDCGRTKACGVIKAANELVLKRNKLPPKRGRCYIKIFCEMTGLSRKEVLEEIRGGN